MLQIVTVRFEQSTKRSDFLARNLEIRVGDWGVVSSERGVEIGRAVHCQRAESVGAKDPKIRKVLRCATERDLYLYAKKSDRETFAFQFCRKRIRVLKLPMKLSGVEYIFDGSRAIFSFTAAQRVDFRDLVKDLARELRTRIEMRQIGARDEAKMVGGLGCCGLDQNCSKAFLTELRSVSVKSAKSQELAINPSRLSGMCGRLKCCLNYELNPGRPRKRAPGSRSPQ